MIEKTLSVCWEKFDLTQNIPSVQCFPKEWPIIPKCILKTSDFALPLVFFLSIDVGQSLGEDQKQCKTKTVDKCSYLKCRARKEIHFLLNLTWWLPCSPPVLCKPRVNPRPPWGEMYTESLTPKLEALTQHLALNFELEEFNCVELL